MNEKTFYDKLTTLLEILEHRLSEKECEELGFSLSIPMLKIN